MRNFKTLLITLAVGVASCAFAQDSLVVYKDLRFTSDLEETAFNQYFRHNDKSQLLALFVSITADTKDQEVKNVRSRIDGVTRIPLC